MTAREIVVFAKHVGLRCHHDDDPDQDDDESVLLWCDAETGPDEGLLIRFHDGLAFVADLNARQMPVSDNSQHCSLNENKGAGVRARIRAYAERWNRAPLPVCEQAMPRLHHQDGPQAAPLRRGRRRRPATQQKDGQFKAKDLLGHFYCIEVYREIADRKTNDEKQRLVTVDGESVERVGKGRYRLVRAGVELSSDDPTAP